MQITSPRRASADPASRRISDELRAELARQRLSGQVAARKLGRASNWLYDRLNGRTPMSIDDLEAVCRLLDLPLLVLVARAVGDQ